MANELEKRANEEPVDTLEEEYSRFLLRHVGTKSTTEIARLTGKKPHEVKRDISALLDSIDVLTIQEQRAKLLIELRTLAQRATQRIEDIGDQVGDREYAQVVSAATQAIRIQLQELARMEKEDDAALQELNKKRLAELLSLVDRTIYLAVGEISQRYELDEGELMDVFSARLVEAAQEMDLGGFDV